MVKTGKALRKNKNMVTRVIEEETILLPVYADSKDINSIYTLNESASKLWSLINGKRSSEDLKAYLVKNFDVSVEEADRKLAVFLKELRSIKAIE